MQINMQPMLNGDTDVIEIDSRLEIPEEYAPDGVKFTGETSVFGEVRNSAGYMTLKLRVETPYSAFCARCLCELDGVFGFDFEKTVANEGTLQNEDSDDYLVIRGAQLDIGGPVAEQIALDFPLRLLCSEDCKGLCPSCGKNLNEGKCSCPEHENDPRLAALAQLLDK